MYITYINYNISHLDFETDHVHIVVLIVVYNQEV